MFVACSTLCFAREPLEKALRQIAELEFDKFELALVEDGQHLRPSEAGDNPEAALQRLRSGPSLIPSSLHIDFGTVDWSDPLTRKRFDGLCRLAKSLSVAVITMHAAPAGTPIADEVARLAPLVSYAMREGLVLALLTHVDTLTADPQVAVELCQLVPGPGPDARPQPLPSGRPSQRRLRRCLSLRPECPPARYGPDARRVSGPRRPGPDRIRPDRQLAPAVWLQPLTDGRHHRPARKPLRSRSRAAQAQALARDVDLTPLTISVSPPGPDEPAHAGAGRGSRPRPGARSRPRLPVAGPERRRPGW